MAMKILLSFMLFISVSLGASLRAETGNCGRFCPTVYEPLCATDGRTYVNECYLAQAQCSDPDLARKYSGECHAVRARGIICTTPWCMPVHEPVCGSDDVTYANVCELNNAMCDNEGLKVQYQGPCHAAPDHP